MNIHCCFESFLSIYDGYEIEITNYMVALLRTADLSSATARRTDGCVRDRPRWWKRRLDTCDGCDRPVKAASEIWLLTFWIDESSFRHGAVAINAANPVAAFQMG